MNLREVCKDIFAVNPHAREYSKYPSTPLAWVHSTCENYDHRHHAVAPSSQNNNGASPTPHFHFDASVHTFVLSLSMFLTLTHDSRSVSHR
ncbi:hypothetical protein HUJ05_001441 [Dendroctonus ponderosae]|nr:hypothetical protein HUJ05_001441 [Dendroctonus ponderosae]